MDSLGRTGFATGSVLVIIAMLFALPLVSQGSEPSASGRFEVYCDGIGIFLTKIEGPPTYRKLVLFSRIDFPPGTLGGRLLGQGKWSDISVLQDGCIPDGKCDSVANGRVWIDAPDTSPDHISGKYEISFNGSLLKGRFHAKRRDRKSPLRLCM
jgi:hypothetical protein